MTYHLLDPTLDVVFKLLLQRNPLLLRDMIESVLGMPGSIRDLTVLNPEIPKDLPAEKSVVLDIRVCLDDGRQIDLEMQSTAPTGTRGRFLYYWAKTFTDALAAGDDYNLLPRCISILWFKVRLLKGQRFHSVFHLAEDETHEVFAGEIEFHVLELPNLHLATADRRAKLQRWARFLRAETAEEFDALATEDETMNSAKIALEELSMDPAAQRLADERKTADRIHRHLIACAQEEGEARGEARGETKGRCAAILAMCNILGIQLTPEAIERLPSFDVERLALIMRSLETERRWPDEL